MKLGSAFIVLLLLAVLGGARTVSATQSVIVAWDPNPETDIVGYNVYTVTPPLPKPPPSLLPTLRTQR